MFTRTRAGSHPWDVERPKYVNRQPLLERAAHCHETAEGLMRDDDLLMLATDPKVDLGEWQVAEVEVDPNTMVVPNAEEVRSGVYAVPLAEIRRTPLDAFIEHYAAHGSPGEQDAAQALQVFLEALVDEDRQDAVPATPQLERGRHGVVTGPVSRRWSSARTRPGTATSRCSPGTR